MKKEIKKIELEVLTGLHIGIGNDTVQIGGIDSEVIKDPIEKLPYIPGSSLKGKLRCLLEVEGGYGELDEKINRFFGVSDKYKRKIEEDIKDLNNEEKEKRRNEYQTPTQLIFRDLFLTKGENGFYDKFKSGEILTESKAEISIDRKKGTVTSAGPRTIERIPPTVKFEGELLIRYFNDNELSEILKILEEGKNLLNKDYLGGSGSRGYGAVKVTLTD
jgi:CRISPR-associated protein Csm3